MSEGRNQGGGGAERDPGLDRLYRAGAGEEPPARLDAAILAAAHREVGARPRALSARLRAWRVPVSIAALVVLSVSLVTLVQEEGGEQLAQPTQGDLFARRGGPTTPADPAARPQAAPQPEAETRNAPARQMEKAPAAASRADSALGSTTAPAAADDSGRRRAAAEPARLPGAELPPAPPPAAATPAPQPFPTAPAPERDRLMAAESGMGADMAARSSGSLASGSRDQAASAARPAPAAKAPAQMRDAAPAGEMAGAAGGMPRAPAAAVPAERQQARVEVRAQKKEGSAPVTAYVASLMKDLDPQPPEKWLERIEALRREGRPAEADELLAEFKRRYPNHPLPAGLR